MLLDGKYDAIIGLDPISDPRLTAVSLFSYPACAVMRSPSSTILYRLCFEYDYLGLTFCAEGNHIYDNDYSRVSIKLSGFCFQGFPVSASSQSRLEALNRYLCFIQAYPFKEKLSQLQLPGISQIML